MKTSVHNRWAKPLRRKIFIINQHFNNFETTPCKNPAFLGEKRSLALAPNNLLNGGLSLKTTTAMMQSEKDDSIVNRETCSTTNQAQKLLPVQISQASGFFFIFVGRVSEVGLLL